MRTSQGKSSTSTSGPGTPLDSSTSPEYHPSEDEDFVDSAFSDSPLSAPSDDDSDDEYASYSEDEKPKKPAKKKTKRDSKSYRLDGGKVDPLPDSWKHRSEEERAAELERIKEEKAVIRKKEAKLKKELGRKLTQGERNLIRLSLHHPQLVDVWGDLEAKIEPVKPVPMEAHPSLKLTLLPFQKESLYWMKKQEEGVWRGGMLADEMGMGKT